MRVVLADPAAFTLPYDHALAAALAVQGLDVTLATSHFRFGEPPVAEGFAVEEIFYPRSARIRRPRARIATRVLEHPVGLARLLRLPHDVLHVQWLTAPEVDRALLRSRRPLVFTAHDLLPRRTAHRHGLWRALFGRFDAVVVHSDRGRERLVEAGVVDEGAVRLIPHPVFASDTPRRDDGATVLALGVIRPYKGLADTVDAVGRLDGARLLVAGDPRIPLDDLVRRAGPRAEWRLGFLGHDELLDALSRATVAAFPYRDELDQSGALLQALGAGVPAVVYDVGGLGQVVDRFGAGIVVPAGDVDALTAALGRLLGDAGALAAARAGADEARRTLTWEAAATAHAALYRELV